LRCGELQSSARAQHPHDLFEDATFVGAEVDDAVADDDIGPTVFNRQILDHPCRNSTLRRPIAVAAARERWSISSVISTPTT
jgi:hypothetical protein